MMKSDNVSDDEWWMMKSYISDDDDDDDHKAYGKQCNLWFNYNDYYYNHHHHHILVGSGSSEPSTPSLLSLQDIQVCDMLCGCLIVINSMDINS